MTDDSSAEAGEHPSSVVPIAGRSRRRATDAATLSDEALLAGMANHDERCGLVFVRRHERRIFGIAFSIVNDRSIAEEVAQEAFVRVWRHAPIFDARRSSVVTWSSTIARNLAIDALRLRRALPIDPDDIIWTGMVSKENSLEDRAVRSDQMAEARAILRTLPVDQRRALIRSAFYGQSAQEIATAEQIPLGTAKSRIRIGLVKVRDALVQDGA
ncbi:MAG TPA: sigma-70 family RNA polymerase sigma factor [Acidimicrobiales bacterium]|jgi:RNA polymerase sigma-70 factor (ECF subfamily)|nr:sigma-70 family RNA polymerase sigma factor [Acidimicrobiales bacterium]